MSAPPPEFPSGSASGPSTEAPKVALVLPGGGLSGALYQIGALAALEDGVEGLHGQGFSLYVGSSSGATVAASLAGGVAVDRIYRALLDPVDNFFPLERGHILRIDLDEWSRTIATAWVAVRHGASRLTSRVEIPTNAPGSMLLLEQIDRLYDSLPAGVFTLDRFERFLAGFFLRRGIPNTFRSMPRSLCVATYDLDSGERVMFGGVGHEDVPVSLACAASLALPVFFSPVRIGGRHYLSGDVGGGLHLDVAEAAGATLCVVVSPLVPFQTKSRAVPTGHGAGESVRDKGLFGVFSQAMRIGAPRIESASRPSGMHVLVVEPEPTDTLIFLHNPANLAARRAILEYAYRTTRERISRWIDRQGAVVERLGWRAS